MFIFVKMAFRNVLRNKRRTIITSIAVSIGIAMMNLIGSLITGQDEQMIDNLVRAQTGHIQIHAKGYSDEARSLPLDVAISDPDRIKNIILGVRDVKSVTKRTRFGGLVSSGEKSVTAMGLAVELDGEAKVSSLSSSIVEGGYFTSASGQMLLGSGLAKAVHGGVGTILTFLTNTAYGAMNAMDFEVSGIFQTGVPQFDDLAAIVTLNDAGRLLDMDERATEIVVLLDDSEKTEMVEAELYGKLKGEEVEINDWKFFNRNLIQFLRLRKFLMNIIFAIVLVVALAGIVNTMIMAIAERTREIGTMEALGLKGSQITAIFLCEAAVIGLLGSTYGCIIGGGLSFYWSVKGISIGNLASGIGLPIESFYADFSPSRIIFAFVFGVCVSALAGLYPAYLAAKLKPVEALRYV